MDGYNSGTAEHVSGDHSQGKDALGMAWLNYTANLAPKNLLMIPAMFAIAMQMNGWVLRNDIIWAKPNGMPESVTDRLSTKHEHVFLFAKKPRYYFDIDAIRVEARSTPEQYRGAAENVRDSSRAKMPGVIPSGVRFSDKAFTSELNEKGVNPGDWWEISTKPFAGAHFATFPPELPERCILAGSRPGDTVLDPFSGSGTTGMVAGKHGRCYVGIDLNPEYHALALKTRLAQGALL